MKKNFALKLCIVVLTFLMLIYPNDTYQAASQGLALWFNIVFPSLLPFFICIDLLISLKLLSAFSTLFNPVMQHIFKLPGVASFAYIMSIFSGYPVGAKITADLIKTNQCSVNDGQKILSLASTSGPLFIMSAVCAGILQAPEYGLILLFVHYASALTTGLMMKFYNSKAELKSQWIPKPMGSTSNNLIGNAINSSIQSLLSVCGYIVLFSVISKIMMKIGIFSFITKILTAIIPIKNLGDILQPVLVGLLEVTGGVQLLSLTSLSLTAKFVIASFLLGFAGLSINMQVYNLIYDTGLKFKPYLFMKFIQGTVAAFYCYIVISFFNEIPAGSIIDQGLDFNFLFILIKQLKLAAAIALPIVLSQIFSVVFRRFL